MINLLLFNIFGFITYFHLFIHASINNDIVIQRHQLLQERGLRHAPHFLFVMPSKQVVNFLGRNWQVLAVVVLEEQVVVFEREEAVLVLVHASEAVSNINLTQLVFAMHFQFVFQL